MKTLEPIQKTFRVFQVLTKIAMILSFVWAGLAALGLLCAMVWYNGGVVIGANPEALLSLTVTSSLKQMMGVLLSELAFALADGTLLAFAFRYFRQEQAEGTPFTHNGAAQIKRLGIRTIVLPLVAAILSAVFYEVFGLSQSVKTDWDNLTSVSLGIVLILASLIFRYGAELEAARPASALRSVDCQS